MTTRSHGFFPTVQAASSQYLLFSFSSPRFLNFRVPPILGLGLLLYPANPWMSTLNDMVFKYSLYADDSQGMSLSSLLLPELSKIAYSPTLWTSPFEYWIYSLNLTRPKLNSWSPLPHLLYPASPPSQLWPQQPSSWLGQGLEVVMDTFNQMEVLSTLKITKIDIASLPLLSV